MVKLQLSTLSAFKPLFFVFGLAMAAFSAHGDDCGLAPQAPEIVDGATASMDALVANSETVKAFISAADQFLDCREAFAKTPEYAGMEAAAQNEYKAGIQSLLEQRNSIGERFNQEVSAYKKLNP